MFKPKDGQITVEPCLDESNWTLDTGQLLDGTLRLQPVTTKYEVVTQSGMIESAWDQTWDFEDSDTTGWLLYNNYVVADGLVRLHGERDYTLSATWDASLGQMTLPSAELTGVDNATGWTVQVTLAVEGVVQFDFYDGTKVVSGRIGEQNGIRGIWLRAPDQASTSTGDFVFPIDGIGNVKAATTTVYTSGGSYQLSSPITVQDYKTIRLSLKGSDITIDVGDKELKLASSSYARTTSTKAFTMYVDGYAQKYGQEVEKYQPSNSFFSNVISSMLNTQTIIRNYTGRGDAWIEDFKVSSTTYQPVNEISRWATVTYPTVTQTAYSPTFTPDPGVTRFLNAYYEVDNSTGEGTLYVTPQYRYSGGVWSNGTQVALTGDYLQSLVSFQPVGDGDDQVRFKFEQASTDGSGDAPRVDQVKVIMARRDNGVYKHIPSWGPREGANTIALDIFRAPQGVYYGTGDAFFLGHAADTQLDLSPNAITVSESGDITSTVSYTSLFEYVEEIVSAPFDGTILADATNPGTGLDVQGDTTEVVQRRHPKTTSEIYMQRITGNSDSSYVKISDIGTISTSKYYVLECVMWIRGGQVKVDIEDSEYDAVPIGPGMSRIYRFAFKSGVTNPEARFYCNASGTDFYIGGFKLYEVTSGYLDCGVNSEINTPESLNVHASVFLNAYPTNNTMIAGNWDGTNGWMLFVDASGHPSVQIGSTTVQGESVITLDQWATISARIEDGFVEVMLNGETSGIAEPSFSAGTGSFYVGAGPDNFTRCIFPGSVANVRVSTEDWSAAEISYYYDRNIIPTFKCEYEPEIDANTLACFTFNNSKGTIENKGSLYNPVIPDRARRWIYRGIKGKIGKAIRIFKGIGEYGYLKVPLFGEVDWLDSAFAIEADVWWSTQAENQTLVSIGAAGETGFQVRKTSENKLQYVYTDASGSRTLTSTVDIATTDWRHFSIVHDRTDNSVEMKINGVDVGSLGTDAVGSMTGDSPANLFIGSYAGTGEGVWVHLDNFKLQGNATGDYSEAYPWTTSHWTPSETVYVDGTALHASRVQHSSPYRKLVVMPSHTPGEVSTRVVGSEYLPVNPYMYSYNYHIELDTGEYETAFGSTRSPFRVMHNPPDHSVKIALLGTTPVSVNTHMSITDLSDREPANRTGYGVPIKMLRGSATHEYADAAETDEVLVTNKSAMWQTLATPKPLFYKYLVGRGRYYVYVPTASTAADVDPIRQDISLYRINNEPIEMAWDISVSSLDYYGESLPANVYSVILLLEDIPGKTMWVSYPSVHFRTLTGASDHRREIVNPVPLFGNHSGRMGITKTINTLGSYDIEVEV